LVVAWGWPPIGRVGSLRPIGFVKEWVARGHSVHVLTGPGDRGGEYTPDLIPAAEATGAIVHRAEAPAIAPPLVAPRAAFESPVGTRVVSRPISRIRQVLGQWRGFPDLQRSWIQPAVRLAQVLHESDAFDVAWSTSPPESVHFVAHALARSVPWVADFRDQWSEYVLARWDPLSRRLVDLVARRVLSRSSAVTAATDGVRESIERTTGRRTALVRNGFDPPPVVGEPVRRRVLGYFGRVDPQLQHPERLWGPLRRLAKGTSPWSLELYTAPGGGGGAAIEVPADLRGIVKSMPMLSHPAALRAMQAMNALLVLAWETPGGEASVGGKVYEYIGAGRPILVCAPPHHENRRLVEDTGTGIGGWSEDELERGLRTLVDFTPRRESRSALSRAACAEACLEILIQVSRRAS
jgi:hypothetical protein